MTCSADRLNEPGSANWKPISPLRVSFVTKFELSACFCRVAQGRLAISLAHGASLPAALYREGGLVLWRDCDHREQEEMTHKGPSVGSR